MKSEDLASMLATGTPAVAEGTALRRSAIALACGVLGSALLMMTMLGVRFDLAHAIKLPMYWVKFAYVASLALASVAICVRVSRPGATLGGMPVALAVPVIAMWALAVYVLANADPAQRRVLLLGGTWDTCPFFIAVLSVPIFVAVIAAMKEFAPTRLRLAGAVAGFASGSTGALVYSIHCPEMAAPFLGLWYLFGMMIPTAVGALLGPRLLRW